MKMILPAIFMIFCLLCCCCSSSHDLLLDFCVADFRAPNGSAGYSCKNPSNVTVIDFVFSGLGVAGNSSNIIKAAFTPAFVAQVPGVNGLGLSMARLDFAVGRVIPIHTHPRTSEVLYVTQGRITAGFISSNNIVYLKTLNQGDLMVFPQGLFHLLFNQDSTPLLQSIASYNSENPYLQILDLSLFGSNLPTEAITAVTFIGTAEVRKLKQLFGGSG